MSEDTNENDTPDPAAVLAAEREAFLKECDATANAFVSVLPDTLKALVPEKLSAAEKVARVAKALKSGAGKNDTKPQTGTRETDTSRLPPAAKIAAGYKK